MQQTLSLLSTDAWLQSKLKVGQDAIADPPSIVNLLQWKNPLSTKFYSLSQTNIKPEVPNIQNQ
jgi:hypothetical protein